MPQASLANAHLKRNATASVARDGPRCAAVMAVTGGRFDSSTELAEVFGTRERIFPGRAEWLACES